MAVVKHSNSHFHQCSFVLDLNSRFSFERILPTMCAHKFNILYSVYSQATIGMGKERVFHVIVFILMRFFIIRQVVLQKTWSFWFNFTRKEKYKLKGPFWKSEKTVSARWKGTEVHVHCCASSTEVSYEFHSDENQHSFVYYLFSV